jgi:glycosyltransferase involved in cell wall biosynthesis
MASPGIKLGIVNLTGGGLSHGYINYLSEVLPRMIAHPRVNQVYAYIPRGYIQYFTGIVPPECLRPFESHFQGRRQLRLDVGQMSPDVVFFPGNQWINLNRIASVAMVQSMLPMVMPFGGNGWLDIVKNLVRARLIRIACQRANRIIAISNYVKEFLVNNWHIAPTRIGMIYHGVNPPPAPGTMKIPASLPEDWRGRFLFTAGSMHPYRALDDVINAMAVLASQGVRPPLVIAGGVDLDRTQWPYLQRMKNLAEKLGVQSQIAWTGHLEADEMSWCYSHCRLFLMTSRVEACPNIALEAMSHGAFCLAADNPPLPEFFQEAALYYRPKDGKALAEAINSALAYSPAAAGLLRRQAKKRAGDFTWEETTARTVHELELATNMVYS